MYQGPIVQNNEEIEGDLKLRIQEAWMKIKSFWSEK